MKQPEVPRSTLSGRDQEAPAGHPSFDVHMSAARRAGVSGGDSVNHQSSSSRQFV